MEQSKFIEWIKKYFPALALGVVEKLNDTKVALPYLHKTMLKKDFSVSGKWESFSAAFSLVAADVVAMDSSLPLKKRDSIQRASGNIAKLGMELKLNESQLTELDTLIATGATDKQILAKLFADMPKVIGGVYERLEAMFLEGLSTGLTVIDDSETVGTGVRLDYGYLAANKFGVTTVWSNTAAKPFDDIDRVLAKASADGNQIVKVLLDKTAFNNLVKTTQAKELYAFSAGFTGANIPTPSFNQLNQLASERYGFVFELVDRTIRTEKNGVQTSVKPWADGAVAFVSNAQVGSLVYAKLAEENHPVSGVEYQKVEDYILVAKFRQNRPTLAEVTNSQARVVPVIANVDSIYTLDSKTVQA